MFKATQQQTKDHNKRFILKTIYSRQAISRANIARATRLTRTTVSNIVNELVDDGWVTEIGYGESRGGKRPILLSLAENSHHLIGVDLGNSQFQGGIFTLQGKMIHSLSLPVGNSQGDEAINLVYRLLDQLIAHSNRNIIGVGIGTPGVTNAQKGVVYEAVNLGWHNVPLTDLLAARYPFPVHIANDSQVAALGEYIFGQARKMSNLVVVKAGQGISAGLVLNGRLYIGERSGQGEIGHVVVDENGKLCRCGHRGCLETIVGTPALVEKARHLAQTEPASALNRFAEKTADINSDTILAAYQAHDPGVQQMIQEVGHYLAIAIAHLIALLNIQHIVIGGRLARFGSDLITIVRDEMAQRVLPKLAEETELSLSNLGENIVVQGGAALLLAQELELV